MIQMVNVTYMILTEDGYKLTAVTPPKHITLYVEGKDMPIIGCFDSVKCPDDPRCGRCIPGE